MKVLIIGGGGREHALAWKVAQAEQVEKVLVAPGNAGTARDAKLENVALDVNDQTGLADLAEREGVALTIVGPEAPLVDGLADSLRDKGFAVFGKTRTGPRRPQLRTQRGHSKTPRRTGSTYDTDASEQVLIPVPSIVSMVWTSRIPRCRGRHPTRPSFT